MNRYSIIFVLLKQKQEWLDLKKMTYPNQKSRQVHMVGIRSYKVAAALELLVNTRDVGLVGTPTLGALAHRI